MSTRAPEHTGASRFRAAVEDDGSGLPASAYPGRGSGLKIMRYRANIIYASIDVTSKSGA